MSLLHVFVSVLMMDTEHARAGFFFAEKKKAPDDLLYSTVKPMIPELSLSLIHSSEHTRPD